MGMHHISVIQFGLWLNYRSQDMLVHKVHFLYRFVSHLKIKYLLSAFRCFELNHELNGYAGSKPKLFL